MLMAGLEGSQNKIEPGPAMDKELYELPTRELKEIPTVCGSLRIVFFQAEDDIRYIGVTGVQTCALPILDAGDAFDEQRAHVEVARRRALLLDVLEGALDLLLGEAQLRGRGARGEAAVVRVQHREIGRASCREIV